MFRNSESIRKCNFLSNTFYNMSGHGQGSPARILKPVPNLPKHRPLKATVPISIKEQGRITCKSSSTTPTFSHLYTWRNRSDPCGRRSPGSSSYKERNKHLDLFGSIRKSASLDTLYLKGNWLRRSYWFSRALQVNKATQTDEADCSDPQTQRQKIESTKEPSSGHSPPGEISLGGSCKPLSACLLSPTMVKPVPKPSLRSSVEALNQEIERIVQSSDSESHSSRLFQSENFYHETPDGHRAPLADILGVTWKSHSVNTQTPHDYGSTTHSSEGSQGSSPDQESGNLGPSPQINKFIAREPPDGCEKIQLKTMSSRRYLLMEHVPPPSTFKLQPSVGSAFEPLQPNTSNTQDENLPLVPFEDF